MPTWKIISDRSGVSISGLPGLCSCQHCPSSQPGIRGPPSRSFAQLCLHHFLFQASFCEQLLFKKLHIPEHSFCSSKEQNPGNYGICWNFRKRNSCLHLDRIEKGQLKVSNIVPLLHGGTAMKHTHSMIFPPSFSL